MYLICVNKLIISFKIINTACKNIVFLFQTSRFTVYNKFYNQHNQHWRNSRYTKAKSLKLRFYGSLIYHCPISLFFISDKSEIPVDQVRNIIIKSIQTRILYEFVFYIFRASNNNFIYIYFNRSWKK